MPRWRAGDSQTPLGADFNRPTRPGRNSWIWGKAVFHRLGVRSKRRFSIKQKDAPMATLSVILTSLVSLKKLGGICLEESKKPRNTEGQILLVATARHAFALPIPDI
jgi:hypothetical protein